MRKTTRRIDGKTVICYEVATKDFLEKQGMIRDLQNESQRLGADCNIEDCGETYRVTLTTPNKQPFWKRKSGEVARFGEYGVYR